MKPQFINDETAGVFLNANPEGHNQYSGVSSKSNQEHAEDADEWIGQEHKTTPEHVATVNQMLANDNDARQKFLTFHRDGPGGSHLSDADANDLARKAKDIGGDSAPSAEHIKALHWAASVEPGLADRHRAAIKDLHNEFKRSHPELED